MDLFASAVLLPLWPGPAVIVLVEPGSQASVVCVLLKVRSQIRDLTCPQLPDLLERTPGGGPKPLGYFPPSTTKWLNDHCFGRREMKEIQMLQVKPETWFCFNEATWTLPMGTEH